VYVFESFFPTRAGQQWRSCASSRWYSRCKTCDDRFSDEGRFGDGDGARDVAQDRHAEGLDRRDLVARKRAARLVHRHEHTDKLCPGTKGLSRNNIYNYSGANV
jgi:hypothetical protein